MIMMAPRYYTVDEAVEVLNIHPDTIRRLLRERRLPGKKIGREWRISQAALDEFILSGEGKPEKAPEQEDA